MVAWVFPCCVLFLLIQNAPCTTVSDKVRDDILHASSYALAYQKYISTFHTSDNLSWRNHGVMSREQLLKKQEREKRKQRRFIMSVKQANKHNKNFNEGLSEYTQTVNEFSIMDEDERHQHLGLTILNKTEDTLAWGRMKRAADSPLIKSTLPNNIDWVKKGFVTKVKDQGSCGACWSFAAIVVLEYVYKKVTKNLISLSEQELLDCTYDGDGVTYRNGCTGGHYNKAFRFAAKNGIPLMRDYPYQGMDLPCMGRRPKNAFEGVLTVSGFEKVRPGSEQEMMYALVNYGPIAAAMFVGNDFYSYNKGLYDGCRTKVTPNHAVTIVGYGPNSWKGKNSWAKSWGLDGYFLTKRHNVCELLNYGAYVGFEVEPGYVPVKDEQDEKTVPRCNDKAKEQEEWHCAYWKTLGNCEKKKQFMAEFCADTCRMCPKKRKWKGKKKNKH